MNDELDPTQIPTELLVEQGRTSGKLQLEKKGKAYFSELGKRSAEKRKHDKRFTNEYYKSLSKKAAEKRKKNREEKKRIHRKIIIQSHISKVSDFLKGEF